MLKSVQVDSDVPFAGFLLVASMLLSDWYSFTAVPYVFMGFYNPGHKHKCISKHRKGAGEQGIPGNRIGRKRSFFCAKRYYEN